MAKLDPRLRSEAELAADELRAHFLFHHLRILLQEAGEALSRMSEETKRDK